MKAAESNHQCDLDYRVISENSFFITVTVDPHLKGGVIYSSNPFFFIHKKNEILVTLKRWFSKLSEAILNSRKLRISTFLKFFIKKSFGGHAATGQQLFTFPKPSLIDVFHCNN